MWLDVIELLVCQTCQRDAEDKQIDLSKVEKAVTRYKKLFLF